ncbi:MAG: hypothetical protein FRX49_05980 [Trebouxia sp. A1-2]|nr:MAG: hypothetical protein FRX49_05980 [Trebouxia sp. A1-2]
MQQLSSSASGGELAELKEKLKGWEEQKAAEMKKEKGTRDLELLVGLNKDLDRTQVAITALSSGLSHQWRHKQVHPSDVDLNNVNGKLTRVFLTSTNECIGTTARIRQDRLCVSARHVFVNGGAFLAAKGWGSQLQFVASPPVMISFSCKPCQQTALEPLSWVIPASFGKKLVIPAMFGTNVNEL